MNTIQSPADLLQLTQEYSDTREQVLKLELGRSIVAAAYLEMEVDASFSTPLTDEEYSQFLRHDTDQSVGSSPAVPIVLKRSKELDKEIFDKITEEDTGNALENYRIADVTPGQICLVNGNLDKNGSLKDIGITLLADISPDGKNISFQKTWEYLGTYHHMKDYEDAPRVVYQAANLLLKHLQPANEPSNSK